jgi:hypothetical protein
MNDHQHLGRQSRFGSIFWSIAKDFLYLMPRSAGEILINSLSHEKDLEENLNWFREVLGYDAKTLVSRITSDGDEGDKRVYATVLLWNQRHGIVDPTVHISRYLPSEPTYYHLHRYMVANGDVALLDRPCFGASARIANVSPELSYRSCVEHCIGQFMSDIPSWDSADFDQLTLSLSVLGPTLDSYPGRDKVVKLTREVISRVDRSSTQATFSDDEGFTRFSWLVSDLRLDPRDTWGTYRHIALAQPTRALSSYPAILAGLQMYGASMKEILANLEMQGGNDLVLSLLS